MRKWPVLVIGVAIVGFLAFNRSNRSTPAATAAATAAAKEPEPGANLGYGTAFAAELKKIGQISVDEFAARYGDKIKFQAKLDWDPTKAAFFERFQADPTAPGAKVRARGVEEDWARRQAQNEGKPIPDGQPVMVPIHHRHDFRLNDDELAVFKKNGFVVSERHAAPSCTELLIRIYRRDLPVFVTSDALLHAWHRSYDAMLEEVELKMLSPALDEILAAMAGETVKASEHYGPGGPLADSVKDADYFLAVARSLLKGSAVEGKLDQQGKVAETVKKCHELQLEKFVLFGKERDVDFSQFKPRGHYEKSEELKRYFRAMMWCGRIDMRVAGNKKFSSERELAGAVVMHDLVRRSGKFESWSKFDRMIQTFVGQTDSMTFGQLDVVLAAANVHSPADVKDPAVLSALERRIEANDFGVQQIRGDVFYGPWEAKVELPRSFTFLGQKFVVDSWVTSNVVYDDVDWDGRKVMRRVPSCLDVSFAVFGNDHVAPLLVERIKNTSGVKFRDGLNYQHNLAALRTVVDAKPAATWDQNLYTGWVGCLRELSKPTTAAEYPQSMRTQAWAMKTANAQHASWTQLRHDTILYAKQSYTRGSSCYYPAGFVEPIPHFWARFEGMAGRASKLIEQSPYADAKLRDKHAAFLRTFAETTATLRGIAEKELAQKELTKAETKFLEDVIKQEHVRAGSGMGAAYRGWYPSLFYYGEDDSRKWDALVADVHTNVPAPMIGDPGCVLHQGIDGADLLVIAIDNGKDRMVYAGPVLSHYEFSVPGVNRRSDAEWKQMLQTGNAPPRPAWTRSYLVPGRQRERHVDGE